jgi:ribonuclease P protein component
MRWLTLAVRFHSKGGHERQAHVSTEHASPETDAWISGPDGYEKRPSRPQTPAREGPQTTDGFERVGAALAAPMAGFRPAERIRRRAEFQHVYERGTRAHSRYCTLFVLPNERAVGRLGIAATRKLGGAVQRNRAKRLIREVFRRNKIAEGLDVVVVPKRELLDASLTVLEADYRTTLERASRRRARSPDADAHSRL